MLCRRSRHCALILVCCVFLLLAPRIGVAGASAQGLNVSRLTLQQVVQKMVEKNAERTIALERYRGKRLYMLDYKGFPSDLHAEMVVDMTYDAPSTKKFTVVSETGSKFLMNLIFKRLMESEQESMNNDNRDNVLLTPRNYNFSNLEYLPADDGCSYVLTLDPKTPNKFLFRGRIWVDATDFAVCRIEAEPAKNPSFWIKKTDIHHSYTKIGDFWLPMENQSVSTMRFSGRATLTIKYQGYEILAAQALKETVASGGSMDPSGLKH